MVAWNGCTISRYYHWDSKGQAASLEEKRIENIVKTVFSGRHDGQKNGKLKINYPYHESVFPLDIAAPTLKWTDNCGKSKNWLVMITFGNGRKPIYALVEEQEWTPDKMIWEEMKSNSIRKPLGIRVMGISELHAGKMVTEDHISISVSEDSVGAPIFYRQVPLPFSTTNFDKIRWRLGDISSYDKPPVVMSKLPVCASCHMFSKDGRLFSMELNYGNDSGAQFITAVRDNIVLTKKDFFSWNEYPRPGVLPKSRGLFGKISPSARFVAASINEISLALITNDFRFSQVFFPTYGILGIYSVEAKAFAPLPGADDYQFVHANPNWSPDEKFIVFARARTKNEVHEDITHVVPLLKDEGIDELNKQYNIQFDLYRIPFNGGEGGIPEPLLGASRNGMSNYFPRYSPDGKWIVFTCSKTGIMLQPDSRLYIIPASGGVAREMTCNRAVFNSWHSWSPNGKWLLFSSKVNTPYTEIFLTHIDAEGRDSPPVVLSRFSDQDYAANVPEFANITSNAIRRIEVVGY
jgi:hypothetical protein